MSRPVGARIIEACTIVELHARPMAYNEIHTHMPGVVRENAGKYCQRAVGLRLMTVDRSKFPAQYAIVAGWREKLGAKVHKPRAVTNHVPMRARLSSVWDMGLVA